MNNKYHVEKLGKCWLKDVGNDASNITTSVADKAISINIVVILWQSWVKVCSKILEKVVWIGCVL